MAAMDLHGVRQNDGAGTGVKVKFIETQFISSDAASFKSVVQRLTGKSAKMPPPAAPMHRPRPRPCRGAAAFGADGEQGRRTYCVSGGSRTVPPKQTGAFEPPRLEELHGLCDFADLLYATAGARRDGGSISGFPY